MANLPLQTMPFIGRADEIVSIAHHLTDPNCRLLTLVGPGGIGKTRLAIEAAGTQVGTFSDGVYFVALQPLISPDSIVPTIASALGFQFYSGDNPKQQLLDYFRNQHTLLLLDNFEHLLDDVSLLNDVLMVAPQVKLLVTSRERLNVTSETVFNVVGMDYPAWEPPEDAFNYAAVKLFMQNAHRVRPNLIVENKDLKHLIRICQLVGGMPLALLLAASWVEMLTLEQLATEISGNIDILETEFRDLPERQRSIRATIDYSWKHLSDTEQSTFKKLSVFRGGFSREAAQIVAETSLKTLMSLVNKSLLSVDNDVRFNVHELLRQYAEEKLHQTPIEWEQVCEFHSQYFADFLGQKEESLHKGIPSTLHDIDPEIENVRSAWDWALEHGSEDDIQSIIIGLWDYYEHRCFYQIAEKIVTAALQSPKIQRESIIGLLHCILGHFRWRLGNREGADESFEEGIGRLRQCGADHNLVISLYLWGYLGLYQGKFEEARTRFEEVIDLSRKTGDNWITAQGLTGLGFLAFQGGQYEFAQNNLEQSLSMQTVVDDPVGRLWTLWHYGRLWMIHKKYEEADKCFSESLEIAEAVGNKFGLAYDLMDLGNLAYYRQDFEDARHKLQRSLDLLTQINSQDFIPRILSRLSSVACAQGQLFESQQYAIRLLAILSQTASMGSEISLDAPDALAGIASLFDKQKAVELAAFVAHNPITYVDIRIEAQHFLIQVERELSAEIFTAAKQRGESAPLRLLVDDLQAILSSQPVSQNEVTVPSYDVAPNFNPDNAEFLSERELEVLRLVATGLSNTEIAQQLFVEVSTIKKHINHIFTKLGVRTRTNALLRAKELHLL